MDARARTRNYDLFKAAVTVVLVIIILILLLQGRAARQEARTPPAIPPTAESAAAAPSTAIAEQVTVTEQATAAPALVATAEPPTAAPALVPTAEPPTAAPTRAPTAEQPTAAPTAVSWAIPTINPPKIGEGGQVSLSGTGQPGATVEVWDGAVKLGTAVVGADGTWSWDGTLEPGDRPLVARTVDGSGKVVNESTPLPVIIPAAKPPVPPTLNEPQIGAQGSITLTGTAEPGTTIEIVADGAVVGSAVVQADGTWSLVYQASPGAHQVEARSQADPTLASGPVSIEVPAVTPQTASPSKPSTAGEGQGYIVQKGDSLSALAARFYGNGALWRLIFDATNARAAEDTSFHLIEKPGFIRPGWKLWIPAR